MPKLPRANGTTGSRSGSAPPARPSVTRTKKSKRRSRGNGRRAPEDFERHPVDEHAAHAPTGSTALTEDQRGLLGDLLAVVEEHAEEAAEPVDRELVEAAFVFA